MFHGLWPENNDGSYPSSCSDVPSLDKDKLTFANPFVNYLSNANTFLNHEWSKHGTCSTHYLKNEESSNPQAYYRGVNRYFEGALAQYRQIKLPTFMLQITVSELQQQVHKRNPQIPLNSIMVMCDGNVQDEKYLTGLWFCSDKVSNKFIPCPAAVTKNACSGTILTR
jgi:ribonuclease T2